MTPGMFLLLVALCVAGAALESFVIRRGAQAISHRRSGRQLFIGRWPHNVILLTSVGVVGTVGRVDVGWAVADLIVVFYAVRIAYLSARGKR